jgi:hypothetical protein
MFGLFKKKSRQEKLYEHYEKLLEESYKLSKTNRTASDEKYKEAQEILVKIDALNNNA